MAFRSLVLALTLVSVAHATQVMHRPEDFKTLLKPHAHFISGVTQNVTERSHIEPRERERSFVNSPLDKRAGGKISAGYFTNWSAHHEIKIYIIPD